MHWLTYAILTVASWGLYGVFLHSGQMAMNDPVLGRYKAFLLVGVAYFIFAVLAPLVLLKANGSDFSFPARGIWISLIAGTLGAVGAFGILLAFGAKGHPQVVMSIVFAGAPIVNAVVATWNSRPWSSSLSRNSARCRSAPPRPLPPATRSRPSSRPCARPGLKRRRPLKMPTAKWTTCVARSAKRSRAAGSSIVSHACGPGAGFCAAK